jgi:hypothetical protein
MKKVLYRGGMIGVALLGAFVSSNSALAASSLIPLSPTQTLFTYEFSETFINRDVIIPVLVGLTDSHNPLQAKVNLGEVAALPSEVSDITAVILSDAPIAHGGYQLKAGEKQAYTLVALVTHTATADRTAFTPRLMSLPFLTQSNGVIQGKSLKTYGHTTDSNSAHVLVTVGEPE